MRTEQLGDTAGILQGRAGDRKAWVSAVLAANWAAAAKAREALSAALPEAQRGRADADAALYAEPQVATSCSGDGGDQGRSKTSHRSCASQPRRPAEPASYKP